VTEVHYEPHELEWTPEKVGRVWRHFAASPAYRGQYFSAHSGAAITERIDAAVPLAGRRVLDFGCGRGDLTERLLDRGALVHGLEFDEEGAEETRRRLGGHVHFGGVELARDLPSSLPADAFDVVVLTEVVEHLLDDQVEPTLTEVHRVLVSGGRVALTTVNDEDLAAAEVHCPDCGASFHRWQHVRAFTPESIAALFEGAGFVTERAEAVEWGLSRATRLRRRLTGRTTPRPHLLYVGSAM
jgi:2-polyprenyl-3-methyl-5-hydroxy-6-metoxy-1,4-benzoquinol methylase